MAEEEVRKEARRKELTLEADFTLGPGQVVHQIFLFFWFHFLLIISMNTARRTLRASTLRMVGPKMQRSCGMLTTSRSTSLSSGSSGEETDGLRDTLEMRREAGEEAKRREKQRERERVERVERDETKEAQLIEPF